MKGSMDRVHRGGPWTGFMKGSMDRVHEGVVNGPGVHILHKLSSIFRLGTHREALLNEHRWDKSPLRSTMSEDRLSS